MERLPRYPGTGRLGGSAVDGSQGLGSCWRTSKAFFRECSRAAELNLTRKKIAKECSYTVCRKKAFEEPLGIPKTGLPSNTRIVVVGPVNASPKKKPFIYIYIVVVPGLGMNLQLYYEDLQGFIGIPITVTLPVTQEKTRNSQSETAVWPPLESE